MLFNAENYPLITAACLRREEIEFEAPIEITSFASSKAAIPAEWSPVPPAVLPSGGYELVFTLAAPNARGELMTQELRVHVDGGIVLYREAGNNIAIKITWPKKT